MATLIYSSAIPELANWTGLNDFGKTFSMASHEDNTATFTTGDNDFMSIRITGTGLTYNQAGVLVGGTVNKIVYDFGGDAYLTIKNLSLDAVSAKSAFEFAGIWALFPATMGKDVVNGSADDDSIFGGDGRDTMNGKGGNDIVDGADGSDRLTGGTGSDTFLFHNNDTGRDVIADFDARGGGRNQDYIDLGGMDYTISHEGKNTVISFDGGAEIVLVGVKPNQISDADFVM